MDTSKIYHDSYGNECSILQMVKREPKWAANRIQAGERAIAKLASQQDDTPDAEIDAKPKRWKPKDIRQGPRTRR